MRRDQVIPPSELDIVMSVLSNPVRRRIIERLSLEAGYPLELSEDLGVHQQLVAKHLKVMEDADVVESRKESSPRGPDRRMYGIAKGVSLSINFSPNLYDIRLSSFADLSLSSRFAALAEFEEKLSRVVKRSNITGEIDSYVDLVAEIDRRMEELDGERDVLHYLRSRVVDAAKECLGGRSVSLKERMVAYHVLNRNERSPSQISRSLGLREENVAEILAKLRTQSILR